MDTLTWNYPTSGPHYDLLGPSTYPAAAVSQLEFAPFYPEHAPAGSGSHDLSALSRTGMLSQPANHQVPLTGIQQTTTQLAGQAAPMWNSNMQTDPVTQPNPVPAPAAIQTPTINVSDASQSSRNQDSLDMMGISGETPSSLKASLHTNAIDLEASRDAQMNPAVANFFHPDPSIPNNVSNTAGKSAATDTNSFPFEHARRQNSANLKGFLKLDVNMGFMGDSKMESPTTMLQPVVGWKKRRSVSDVGPRTPSMLGPSVDALTSPIDDLSYLVDSLSNRPHPNKDHMYLAPTDEHDSALNLESLNLDADEQSAPQVSSQAAMQSPAGTNHEKSQTTVLEATRQDPMQSNSAGELNLNTIFIQEAPDPQSLMDQSLASALTDQNLYGPCLDEAKESSSTGPIRSCTSGRSSRSVSPYHASTRSMTPESERSLDEMVQIEAATRMSQWRFPLNPGHSHKNDTLHPFDAYNYSGTGSTPLQGGMRYPSMNARRHMRAAISEDFRGHGKMDYMGAWGKSLDLTRQDQALFNNMFMGNDLHAGSVGMMRCASSPIKTVGASPIMADPLASPNAMTPSSLGVSVETLGPKQPVGENQLKRAMESTLSHTRVKSESSESAMQMAAQTHTPVVTTTAAQAASASRRKAEALFTCPFPDCGSTFTRQYNLRGHMRSHMDERPFKCEWPGCGRSFARTHDCKRHHNLHLNIKPYQCEGCGKTFARLDALNRHHKSEASTCGVKASELKTNV